MFTGSKILAPEVEREFVNKDIWVVRTIINLKILSFYEYGRIEGRRFCSKLKRLFNKGKKFESLKHLLFDGVFDLEVRKSLLDEISR